MAGSHIFLSNAPTHGANRNDEVWVNFHFCSDFRWELVQVGTGQSQITGEIQSPICAREKSRRCRRSCKTRVVQLGFQIAENKLQSLLFSFPFSNEIARSHGLAQHCCCVSFHLVAQLDMSFTSPFFKRGCQPEPEEKVPSEATLSPFNFFTLLTFSCSVQFLFRILNSSCHSSF